MLPTDDPENPNARRRSSDPVRVWLVDRTESGDERRSIALTYATRDGSYEFEKGRTLADSSDETSEIPVTIDIDPGKLTRVTDRERRERFASDVDRVAAETGDDDGT